MLKTLMNQDLAYAYDMLKFSTFSKFWEMTAYLDYFSDIFQACYMLILCSQIKQI